MPAIKARIAVSSELKLFAATVSVGDGVETGVGVELFGVGAGATGAERPGSAEYAEGAPTIKSRAVTSALMSKG